MSGRADDHKSRSIKQTAQGPGPAQDHDHKQGYEYKRRHGTEPTSLGLLQGHEQTANTPLSSHHQHTPHKGADAMEHSTDTETNDHHEHGRTSQGRTAVDVLPAYDRLHPATRHCPVFIRVDPAFFQSGIVDLFQGLRYLPARPHPVPRPLRWLPPVKAKRFGPRETAVRAIAVCAILDVPVHVGWTAIRTFERLGALRRMVEVRILRETQHIVGSLLQFQFNQGEVLVAEVINYSPANHTIAYVNVISTHPDFYNGATVRMSVTALPHTRACCLYREETRFPHALTTDELFEVTRNHQQLVSHYRSLCRRADPRDMNIFRDVQACIDIAPLHTKLVMELSEGETHFNATKSYSREANVSIQMPERALGSDAARSQDQPRRLPRAPTRAETKLELLQRQGMDLMKLYKGWRESRLGVLGGPDLESPSYDEGPGPTPISPLSRISPTNNNVNAPHMSQLSQSSENFRHASPPQQQYPTPSPKAHGFTGQDAQTSQQTSRPARSVSDALKRLGRPCSPEEIDEAYQLIDDVYNEAYDREKYEEEQRERKVSVVIDFSGRDVNLPSKTRRPRLIVSQSVDDLLDAPVPTLGQDRVSPRLDRGRETRSLKAFAELLRTMQIAKNVAYKPMSDVPTPGLLYLKVVATSTYVYAPEYNAREVAAYLDAFCQPPKLTPLQEIQHEYRKWCIANNRAFYNPAYEGIDKQQQSEDVAPARGSQKESIGMHSPAITIGGPLTDILPAGLRHFTLDMNPNHFFLDSVEVLLCGKGFAEVAHEEELQGEASHVPYEDEGDVCEIFNDYEGSNFPQTNLSHVADEDRAESIQQREVDRDAKLKEAVIKTVPVDTRAPPLLPIPKPAGFSAPRPPPFPRKFVATKDAKTAILNSAATLHANYDGSLREDTCSEDGEDENVRTHRLDQRALSLSSIGDCVYNTIGSVGKRIGKSDFMRAYRTGLARHSEKSSHPGHKSMEQRQNPKVDDITWTKHIAAISKAKQLFVRTSFEVLPAAEKVVILFPRPLYPGEVFVLRIRGRARVACWPAVAMGAYEDTYEYGRVSQEMPHRERPRQDVDENAAVRLDTPRSTEDQSSSSSTNSISHNEASAEVTDDHCDPNSERIQQTLIAISKQDEHYYADLQPRSMALDSDLLIERSTFNELVHLVADASQRPTVNERSSEGERLDSKHDEAEGSQLGVWTRECQDIVGSIRPVPLLARPRLAHRYGRPVPTVATQLVGCGCASLFPTVDSMSAKQYFTTTLIAPEVYTTMLFPGDIAERHLHRDPQSGLMTPILTRLPPPRNESKGALGPQSGIRCISAIANELEETIPNIVPNDESQPWQPLGSWHRHLITFTNWMHPLPSYQLYVGFGRFRTYATMLYYPDSDLPKTHSEVGIERSNATLRNGGIDSPRGVFELSTGKIRTTPSLSLSPSAKRSYSSVLQQSDAPNLGTSASLKLRRMYGKAYFDVPTCVQLETLLPPEVKAEVQDVLASLFEIRDNISWTYLTFAPRQHSHLTLSNTDQNCCGILRAGDPATAPLCLIRLARALGVRDEFLRRLELASKLLEHLEQKSHTAALQEDQNTANHLPEMKCGSELPFRILSNKQTPYNRTWMREPSDMITVTNCLRIGDCPYSKYAGENNSNSEVEVLAEDPWLVFWDEADPAIHCAGPYGTYLGDAANILPWRDLDISHTIELERSVELSSRMPADRAALRQAADTIVSNDSQNTLTAMQRKELENGLLAILRELEEGYLGCRAQLQHRFSVWTDHIESILRQTEDWQYEREDSRRAGYELRTSVAEEIIKEELAKPASACHSSEHEDSFYSKLMKETGDSWWRTGNLATRKVPAQIIRRRVLRGAQLRCLDTIYRVCVHRSLQQGTTEHGPLVSVGCHQALLCPSGTDAEYIAALGGQSHMFTHYLLSTLITPRVSADWWISESLVHAISRFWENSVLGSRWLRLLRVESVQSTLNDYIIADDVEVPFPGERPFGSVGTLVNSLNIIKAVESVRMLALIVGEDPFICFLNEIFRVARGRLMGLREAITVLARVCAASRPDTITTSTVSTLSTCAAAGAVSLELSGWQRIFAAPPTINGGVSDNETMPLGRTITRIASEDQARPALQDITDAEVATAAEAQTLVPTALVLSDDLLKLLFTPQISKEDLLAICQRSSLVQRALEIEHREPSNSAEGLRAIGPSVTSATMDIQNRMSSTTSSPAGSQASSAVSRPLSLRQSVWLEFSQHVGLLNSMDIPLTISGTLLPTLALGWDESTALAPLHELILGALSAAVSSAESSVARMINDVCYELRELHRTRGSASQCKDFLSRTELRTKAGVGLDISDHQTRAIQRWSKQWMPRPCLCDACLTDFFALWMRRGGYPSVFYSLLIPNQMTLTRWSDDSMAGVPGAVSIYSDAFISIAPSDGTSDTSKNEGFATTEPSKAAMMNQSSEEPEASECRIKIQASVTSNTDQVPATPLRKASSHHFFRDVSPHQQRGASPAVSLECRTPYARSQSGTPHRTPLVPNAPPVMNPFTITKVISQPTLVGKTAPHGVYAMSPIHGGTSPMVPNQIPIFHSSLFSAKNAAFLTSSDSLFIPDAALPKKHMSTSKKRAVREPLESPQERSSIAVQPEEHDDLEIIPSPTESSKDSASRESAKTSAHQKLSPKGGVLLPEHSQQSISMDMGGQAGKQPPGSSGDATSRGSQQQSSQNHSPGSRSSGIPDSQTEIVLPHTVDVYVLELRQTGFEQHGVDSGHGQVPYRLPLDWSLSRDGHIIASGIHYMRYPREQIIILVPSRYVDQAYGLRANPEGIDHTCMTPVSAGPCMTCVQPRLLSYVVVNAFQSFFGTAQPVREIPKIAQALALSHPDSFIRWFGYIRLLKLELQAAMQALLECDFVLRMATMAPQDRRTIGPAACLPREITDRRPQLCHIVSPEFIVVHLAILFDKGLDPATRAMMLKRSTVAVPPEHSFLHRLVEDARLGIEQAIFYTAPEAILSLFLDMHAQSSSVKRPHIGLRQRLLTDYLLQLIIHGLLYEPMFAYPRVAEALKLPATSIAGRTAFDRSAPVLPSDPRYEMSYIRETLPYSVAEPLSPSSAEMIIEDSQTVGCTELSMVDKQAEALVQRFEISVECPSVSEGLHYLGKLPLENLETRRVDLSGIHTNGIVYDQLPHTLHTSGPINDEENAPEAQPGYPQAITRSLASTFPMIESYQHKRKVTYEGLPGARFYAVELEKNWLSPICSWYLHHETMDLQHASSPAKTLPCAAVLVARPSQALQPTELPVAAAPMPSGSTSAIGESQEESKLGACTTRARTSDLGFYLPNLDFFDLISTLLRSKATSNKAMGLQILLNLVLNDEPDVFFSEVPPTCTAPSCFARCIERSRKLISDELMYEVFRFGDMDVTTLAQLPYSEFAPSGLVKILNRMDYIPHPDQDWDPLEEFDDEDEIIALRFRVKECQNGAFIREPPAEYVQSMNGTDVELDSVFPCLLRRAVYSAEWRANQAKRIDAQVFKASRSKSPQLPDPEIFFSESQVFPQRRRYCPHDNACTSHHSVQRLYILQETMFGNNLPGMQGERTDFHTDSSRHTSKVMLHSLEQCNERFFKMVKGIMIYNDSHEFLPSEDAPCTLARCRLECRRAYRRLLREAWRYFAATGPMISMYLRVLASTDAPSVTSAIRHALSPAWGLLNHPLQLRWLAHGMNTNAKHIFMTPPGLTLISDILPFMAEVNLTIATVCLLPLQGLLQNKLSEGQRRAISVMLRTVCERLDWLLKNRIALNTAANDWLLRYEGRMRKMTPQQSQPEAEKEAESRQSRPDSTSESSDTPPFERPLESDETAFSRLIEHLLQLSVT